MGREEGRKRGPAGNLNPRLPRSFRGASAKLPRKSGFEPDFQQGGKDRAGQGSTGRTGQGRAGGQSKGKAGQGQRQGQGRNHRKSHANLQEITMI